MNLTSVHDERPLRTFFAVEVPAAVQAQLGKVTAIFRDRTANGAVRWVPPENIHLTLRFIGNVLPAELEVLKTAVRDAARGEGPLVLRLGRPGCFPGERSPRVIWVGLDGDIEALSRLQSSVVEATARWGEIEDRPFHPHLTLGRVTTSRRSEWQQISDAIRAAAVPDCAEWRATSFQLMSSRLAPGGSQYSTLASFPLIG